MISNKNRLLSAALIATAFLTVPSYAAGKQRAVRHPAQAAVFTSTVSGTIVDSVTGQPVASAQVRAGGRSDATDAAGKYSIRNAASAQGKIVVEVSRSGYNTKTATITTGGPQTVSLSLDPRPTVTLKKTDGTTTQVDFESIEFGYPIAFSGYRQADFEDFCLPSGEKVVIDRTQISRINGPATTVTDAPCCPGAQGLKLNATLKTGQTTDLFFVDACNGFPNIDVIARDHVTGKFQYIPFTTIQEIVFP